MRPGEKITALGTVEPEVMAVVFAQVAGMIGSLGADPHATGKSIDYGSAVEAGTVFAKIDSVLYKVRVARKRAGCAHAEAELERATINMKVAEAKLHRAQDRKKNTAISDSDFDLAKFKCKVAKASVAVAKAALAQAQRGLYSVCQRCL
jgi:HlyD family secretion protein